MHRASEIHPLAQGHQFRSAVKAHCEAKAIELWESVSRRYGLDEGLRSRFVADKTCDFMRTMTVAEKAALIRRFDVAS